MAENKQVRRGIKQLQRVKTWQLVILLILVGVVAATFLRLNNIGMIERRAAVIAADEAGNEEVTTQRLYDLQRYVSAHMNTDLGAGVYLESRYNRDLQRWQEQQYGDQNPNGNIYQKAQEVCAPRYSSYSSAYLLCVTGELAKYPSSEASASEVGKPNPETYKHVFVSPLWSPDFAGWTVLLVVVIVVVIIVRLISLGVLHLMLRQRYKSL